MLNGIEVVSQSGATLSLNLAEIIEGYSVQDIQGLDPVPANIVSSSFARLDGDQFQSARREKRNQVIRLGLEPDYVGFTTQQLRTRLYEWFMPKSDVLLRYFTDEIPVLEIAGKVESFSCPLFVKEPVATISVLNFDPDFYEPEELSFSNTSTSTEIGVEVDYDGSIDTGVVFELMVNRSVTDFTLIFESPTGSSIEMPVFGAFVAGDVITISTIPGDKYVRLLRGSVETSILYALSPFAGWGRFYPGKNVFRVSALGMGIPYTVRYTNKHGGL